MEHEFKLEKQTVLLLAMMLSLNVNISIEGGGLGGELLC